MDLFNDEDPNQRQTTFSESESTQPVEGVLSGDYMKPLRKLGEFRPSQSPREPNGTKDESLASDVSVQQDLLRSLRYDLHGLGETQSQLENASGGARKEKGASAFDAKNNQTDTRLRQLGISRSVELMPPPGPLKSATVQKPLVRDSPRTTRSSTTPLRRVSANKATQPPRTRKALDQLSQDSFAGVISQDPERVFLAKSKNFQAPISELVGLSQETPVEPERMPKKPWLAPDGTNDSPGGSVVVASTPSQSDGSQSQEHEQQGQSLEEPPREPSQRSTEHESDVSMDQPSQPTSSYTRLLADGKYAVDPVAESEPEVETQLSPEMATQPSSQYGTSLRQDANQILAGPSGFQGGWNTRRILPSKNGRTGQLAGGTGAYSSEVDDIINEENFFFAPQVILPSKPKDFDTQHSKASVPRSTRQAPQQSVVAENANPASNVPSKRINPRKPLSMEKDQDAMDIVPDSEPNREPTTPKDRRSRSTESPAGRRRTPRSNTNSKNRVPASDDEEERQTTDSALVDEEDSRKVERELERTEDESANVDQSQDIPLADVLAEKARSSISASERHSSVHTTPGKGKRLAQNATTPVHVARRRVAVRNDSPNTIVRGTAAVGRSWVDSEVPSSAPEQDMKGLVETSRRNKTSTVAKEAKPSSKALTRVKAVVKYTSASTKKRKLSTETDESEDELARPKDKSVLKLEEEEEETETGDDQEQDQEEDFEEDPGQPKKRKRTGKAVTKKKTTSQRSTRTTSNATSKVVKSTPLGRQTKARRPAMSASASRHNSIQQPTRVFAFWRGDGHYYPGTILEWESDTSYKVLFDDGDEESLDLWKMKRCELLEGDEVIHGNRIKVKVLVDSASDKVLVETDEDGEPDQVKLLVSQLRIAARTIGKWEGRDLDADTVVPMRQKSSRSSSTPSHASVFSAPSLRSVRGGILSKTALIITLKLGQDDWEGEKNAMMVSIKSQGGVVIDELSSVFKMEGAHSNGGKRWVIYSEDFKWTGFGVARDVDRVFVVSDDVNQKPKYLIALALGIPCLSVDWLNDSIDSGSSLDWQPYLLPQGTSEFLNAKVSQFVDLNWCNSGDHLTNILSNKVASKLFDGSSILCIGPGTVPLAKGKKASSDKKLEASRMVPYVILTMGAKRVEAVEDRRWASLDPAQYDYVVAKDKEVRKALLKDGVKCVDFPWVKGCLIARRILPLPNGST